MDIDVPFYGNLILCLTMVAAAYTMAMGMGAGRGRPHLLVAARWGTYATVALTVVAVCVLAYAFQTHDFRIRYVARYSDRTMPWWYLVASLWGGQDGSLLWWLLLLAGYTVSAVIWMRGRLLELQPWIIATLMSIFLFFLTLMLFAANPFDTFVAASPNDGEGLNPLLQNYWMMIHPPTLYMGFVGWAIPFAFVVAALITGRLHDEWVKAARIWAMISWTFLSIGLLLGCLWSYEELGWGGYWAWDPVENASFMPWLVGTAYLHSAMVQERLGMLKVWNVFLLCLTFFMTIFGTFLTRSGVIASVHSFARSDIGTYFLWYLGALIVFFFVVLAWRLPKLHGDHKLQGLLSREFFFLLNNWVLLGMMIFVLIATTYPLISEWLRGEEVTVGPGFYNEWMVIPGLMLIVLTGVGPLVSWRKATAKNLGLALVFPSILGVVVLVIHLAVGDALDFPGVVETDQIYDTAVGAALGKLHAVMPLLSTSTCGFALGCILQEFWRGTRARMSGKGEGALVALTRLVSRARRRYGGYLVHVGIIAMVFGFTGAAWDQENEAAVRPDGSLAVGDYTFRYDGPEMRHDDPNRREIYANLTVLDADGEEIAEAHPAKFIYRTHPEMPTTEVDIRKHLVEDLYVILSTVDPSTRRATIRVIVRPLVTWIWIGGLLLILGSVIAMWPRASELLSRQDSRDARRRRKARGGKGGAAAATLALLGLLAGGSGTVAHAQNDSSSTLHAGSVVIHDPVERQLFERLLCQCGDCQRLPLDSCSCGWAEEKRAELRALLAANHTPNEIQAQFRAQYGPRAIAIPEDKGLDRALWLAPGLGIVLAVGGIFWLGVRWRRRAAPSEVAPSAPVAGGDQGEYADRLEDELRRLEGDL